MTALNELYLLFKRMRSLALLLRILAQPSLRARQVCVSNLRPKNHRHDRHREPEHQKDVQNSQIELEIASRYDCNPSNSHHCCSIIYLNWLWSDWHEARQEKFGQLGIAV